MGDFKFRVWGMSGSVFMTLGVDPRVYVGFLKVGYQRDAKGTREFSEKYAAPHCGLRHGFSEDKPAKVLPKGHGDRP